jgi:hypothetical protein
MPYPFHLLENEKISATAQDLETFIRHALGQHLFIVEKLNLDETNRRFQLYFWQRHIGLDRHMNDGEIGKIYWGGVEIIEWSDSTEITRMWAHTPEDWYIGMFGLNVNKEMEKRYEWLEGLSNEIREHFKQSVGEEQRVAQVGKTKPESKVLPRVPKQLKRLNDWKAAWRKVKGRWKGGSTYQELAKLANLSTETIADIVKAGDAGLLD